MTAPELSLPPAMTRRELRERERAAAEAAAQPLVPGPFMVPTSDGPLWSVGGVPAPDASTASTAFPPPPSVEPVAPAPSAPAVAAPPAPVAPALGLLAPALGPLPAPEPAPTAAPAPAAPAAELPPTAPAALGPIRSADPADGERVVLDSSLAPAFMPTIGGNPWAPTPPTPASAMKAVALSIEPPLAAAAAPQPEQPPARRRGPILSRLRAQGSVDTRTALASARRARPVRSSIASKALSGTAMLFAGAMLVGTTLPANALDVFTVSQAADTALLASSLPIEGQSVAVEEGVLPTIPERDGFEVKTWAQQLREKYGTRGSYTYSVGNGGPIRWPFPYFVPISSGFGERAAPCRGCSTTHNAIDLTPGAGAPIYAIADGVVIRREPRGGSWGNNLTIEHNINGQKVTSSYAHMQWDSSPIQLGDQIKVGDFLGLVGATGQATGAHLHLEIKVNGVYVDPYIWLKENAG